MLLFRYGLECLFRFFSYGLEKKFRPEVYKDFQTNTLKDHESGQMYGLEKFWAFLHYYKHADELYVQPKLKKILEDFKSIDDFKVLYTVSLSRTRSNSTSPPLAVMSNPHIFNRAFAIVKCQLITKPFTDSLTTTMNIAGGGYWEAITKPLVLTDRDGSWWRSPVTNDVRG